MSKRTREQLEAMDLQTLHDIADEYRLYDLLSNDDDEPSKEEMINDILDAQKDADEMLQRENEYALKRLKNSIMTRD